MAPFSRIQASAALVSRPPENAIPTFSPLGRDCRIVAMANSNRIGGSHFRKGRPMPSFDIMCEANAVELKNAVDTANKEVANRYDFKGSDARFELNEKEHEITAYADDDFKLGQVRDVLLSKMAKRGVDARFLDVKDPEKIGGDKMKKKIVVKN